MNYFFIFTIIQGSLIKTLQSLEFSQLKAGFSYLLIAQVNL